MNEIPDNPLHCPHCGAALPANAPEGLCPRCVAANLAAETEVKTEAGPGGTEIHKSAPVQPPPIEEIAKLFPQLEILAVLGQGGMGTVYKARQPRLDRMVALKILSGQRKSDPQFAERFEREARTLALLHHPNIVAIYDVGETQGNFYLLMEFVDGLTLRQLLQTRKLSPEEALTIVPKICEALQYAHQQGIVHRDIKPENILLDKKGQVKIADFGIAKIIGEEAQAGLTQERQIIGTPHYMAPEQVERPKTVDHRADIYSLGVVLYEMLTGELPLGKFAVPSRKVQVDVRLDEVVLHALEKEPDRRYQEASQVKTDMEQIAAGNMKPLFAAGMTASALTPAVSEKTILPAFLLAFFFGMFGAHRFYVGKNRSGFVQLGGFVWWVFLIIACALDLFPGQPTLGILLGFSIFGCAIMQTIDWILIACRAFTDGEGKRLANWVRPQTAGPNPGGGTYPGSQNQPPTFGSVPPTSPGQSGNTLGVAPGAVPMTMTTPPSSGTGKIIAPAVALMIGGAWKLMGAIVGLVFVTGATLPGLANLPGFNVDFLGHWTALASAGIIFFKVVPAFLILFGAYQMVQLRSYSWSLAAAIVSVIACSLLGLAAGIWAVIVLMQPDVRAAFARAGTNPPVKSAAWSRAGVGIAVLAVLLVAGTVYGLTAFFASSSHGDTVPMADNTDLVEIEPDATGGSSNALELDTNAAGHRVPDALAGGTNSARHHLYSGNVANFTKSFTVTPGGKLTMKVDRGDIVVSGGTNDAVEVRVTREVTRASAAVAAKIIKEHRIELRQTGNAISITAETPRSLNFGSWFGFFTNPNLEVHYEITVPSRYDVQLNTSGGNVDLSGLQGQLKAETIGGNLEFVDVDGQADGRTMGGNVSAVDCRAKLALHTSGGNVSIEKFTGPSVQAETMGGHVSADFAVAPISDCDLHTAGGNVTAGLPSSARVMIDAETSGGSVTSELPVQTEGKHDATRLHGSVNGGGPVVKLHTMGGNVEIVKR